MKRRLLAMSRIRKIQNDLHLIAERRLTEAMAREAVLSGERMELIEALNDHEVFYGSFIYPMAKRLRAVDEAAERVAREVSEKSRKVLAESVRKKGVERLHASLSSEWNRSESKRELVELIERSAAPPKSSLP